MLFFLIEYRRSLRVLLSKGSKNYLYGQTVPINEFVRLEQGETGLQIGVKNEIGKKFNGDWIAIDKYDESEFIDYNMDVLDLEFDDDSFSRIVCWSILEHVASPRKAIEELYRVLKPGGYIWVQLPFYFPYHEDPKDYWRVTPDGLRIWMSNFQEIECGSILWAKSSLISASFFHGRKALSDSPE